MSYKKLGEYIQQVNNRNRDLEVETLLGVSITKKLIPSIANTIGTDMSVYKIIERGQFAYGTITSRNGDKISIALLDEYAKALVSQIYVVFEVKDQAELLPEYLILWFSRPEFDRYARFKSHGSTREAFDWEELCEVELPIPSIEKQRQIVAQYEAVTNKIKVNEAICEKLETTAQALYKQWFADFEFPNEQGQPYKSSGGTMVYHEELEKEIPEGWEVSSVGENFKISGGGTPKTEIEEYWKEGNILWYSPTDLTKSNSLFSKDTDKKITKDGLKNSSAKLIPIDSVLMTSRATIGKVCFNEVESSTNQGFINILPHTVFSKYFIYCWINDNLSTIYSLSTGSTFLEISKGSFNSIKFLKSENNDIYRLFNDLIAPLFFQIKNIEFQTKKLTQLQSLLLSRLATLEG
ncbi:restriction endonuclease subunit S [Myroides odoratimimus]|uniref:restriction endonuclease subunit S n=1 Tax=Myroides odoratimimus TaxID=76832 RepID=UPI002DBCBD46|nr:restriction endonuclease subunit S [Myroides odoratimimus]MEC4092464.1 restriction endonuclease subunit S [Myroides odoratimimus]